MKQIEKAKKAAMITILDSPGTETKKMLSEANLEIQKSRTPLSSTMFSEES